MPERLPTPSPVGPPARNRLRPALLLAGYTAAVFALSHQSQPPFPAALFQVPDKALHALEYAPLAFLWGWVLPGPPGRRALLGWLAAALFGLTDELHQAFVPGREASLLDWAADLVGAAAGAAGLAWAARRAGRKKSRGAPQVPGRPGRS